VAVELVIGLAFAMVMHRAVFGRHTVRTAILIPYGIITVVSAFSWQFAFSLNNGFINQWFQWLPFINHDTSWYSHHWPAMYAICVSEIWKTTPFMSLLLLAGLSQVSEDMLEAAKVDGATWWQRLFKVILPNMRAAIMVAVLFRALDAFRIYDAVFIFSRGADATDADKKKPRSPPKQRGPPEDGIPSKTKVMVANLPYDLREDKLMELFKDYSPAHAKIALRPIPRFMVKKLQARGEARKGRGFGFVTLASEELQQKACNEMNGTLIDGREIAVKVAIDSPGKEDDDIVKSPTDEATPSGGENTPPAATESKPVAAAA